MMRNLRELETLDSNKYEDQLADGRTPDDESINSFVVLIRTRDSQLCNQSKIKRSHFYRTLFMDNLVHLGFPTKSRSSYSKQTKNTHE